MFQIQTRNQCLLGPTKPIGKFETTKTQISDTGRATAVHDGYKQDSKTSKRLATRRAMSTKYQRLSELWDTSSVNGPHVKCYETTYRPLSSLAVLLGEDVAVRVDVVASVGVGNTSD